MPRITSATCDCIATILEASRGVLPSRAGTGSFTQQFALLDALDAPHAEHGEIPYTHGREKMRA